MMSEQNTHPKESKKSRAAQPEAPEVEAQAAEDVQVLVGEEALRAEIAEWKAKADEYLDGWQRSRAEFANYKKRLEREQAMVYQSASASVIKRFLDVLDDLDRALSNGPRSGDGAVWAQGIELIYRKMLAVLESSGVSLMQTDGQLFDPNLHEALSHEAHEGYQSGQIIEVIKQGYMLGERVLRPALVRVAQ
jgi:molecular chaperone GrpE